jgi:hypothetical protein
LTPRTSLARDPLVSPSRQWLTGASASTVAAYPDGVGAGLCVVAFAVLDHPEVSVPLTALTRKKYCVPALNPVTESDVVPAATAVVTGALNVAVVDRSTTNPVSLLDVSAQVRLIWEVDVAVAASVVGADGAVGPGAGACVVALRAPDHADESVAVIALTRYQYCVLPVRPVSLYVVAPAGRVIAVGLVNVELVDRSTTNPVSLSEVSVHARSICVADTAVADRFDGVATPTAVLTPAS